MKKQVIFKRVLALLLILAPFFSSGNIIGSWNASGSGAVSWTTGNWAQFNGVSWVSNPAYIPLSTDTVYILSGYTMTVTNGDSCYDLIVESGAQLYSNDASGTQYDLSVYGKFVSDSGIIGNPGTTDGIVFDIEGKNCTISGPGVFEAFRMRKSSKTSPAANSTNLVISMNISLRYNATAKCADIYNNVSTGTGAPFNLTISAGDTVTLSSYGATKYGNIAIDGTQGVSSGPDRWGTFTVNGVLLVADTLFLNSGNLNLGDTCAWVINGVVKAGAIVANASATAGAPHTLTMNTGSDLQITGTPNTTFSNTNNLYTLYAGSTIEYNGAGAQNIDNNLVYVNLSLGGSGSKTASGNLNISGNLTINSPDILVPNTALFIGGNWTDWASGGFTSVGSTVTFNGSGNQTILSNNGQSFANLIINKTGGYVVLDSASKSKITITNALTLTYGIIIDDTSNTGTNIVSIANGASVSATNNNSFVYGRVSKVGIAGSSFAFPVGKGSEYRPITVSNSSANSTVIAQYFYQNPYLGVPTVYDTSQKSAPIDHVSGAEYWTLVTSSTITANLTLQWDTYSKGVTDTANLLIADDALPSWANLGHGTTSGTLAQGTLSTPSTITFTSGKLVAYTFASLSPDPNNPLPVSLLSFTAQAEPHNVLLNWTTASEINNDFFTIEKTADGVTYESVAEVKGAGNSNAEINYTFTDNNPFEGTSYYRLKQSDYDGRYAYSQPIAVNYNKQQTTMITLFPNPTPDRAYINITWETMSKTNIKEKIYTLHVFDVSGREAMPQQTIHFSYGMLQALDVTELPKGVYILQLNDDTEMQQTSLVKE